jgi:hypothetical protein
MKTLQGLVLSAYNLFNGCFEIKLQNKHLPAACVLSIGQLVIPGFFQYISSCNNN